MVVPPLKTAAEAASRLLLNLLPRVFCVGAGAIALSGCYGLASDASYPDVDGEAVEGSLFSPELHDDPSVAFDGLLIRDDVCGDLAYGTETRALAQDALARFLAGSRGGEARQVKARGNLYWFEFPGPEDDPPLRLRLAVLGDPEEAADELHRALLDHGPGWWGLRRSNLSILAPKASLEEAVHFAVDHKLVCWGMMSYAGLDDVYVIPGPYMEL
ncbi:MAG: hypothetical protein AAGN82_16040 [Myxococcota bacterium]